MILAHFGDDEKRKSKEGKGFRFSDRIFDTDEVDGSSPFGPAILTRAAAGGLQDLDQSLRTTF